MCVKPSSWPRVLWNSSPGRKQCCLFNWQDQTSSLNHLLYLFIFYVYWEDYSATGEKIKCLLLPTHQYCSCSGPSLFTVTFYWASLTLVKLAATVELNYKWHIKHVLFWIRKMIYLSEYNCLVPSHLCLYLSPILPLACIPPTQVHCWFEN